MVALYEELTDTNTRIAQTLKRMACFFDNTEEIRQCSGRLDCVANMLRANRKLEHMQLVVPPEIRGEVEAELKSFDNEPIPVVLEPFPLEGRLAFLSVFKSSGGAEREGAEKRAKSDTNVVKLPASSVLADFSVDRLAFSTIFSFAATPVRRQVHVTASRLVLR